jgi:hypothetical protein
MTTRVGMLTIGQSPRPDLVAPFAGLRPEVELLQAGALDGLTRADLASLRDLDALRSIADSRVDRVDEGDRVDRYPLTTRLADGTPITLDEATLAPLVAAALRRLEGQGAIATLLLCAGGFASVCGDRPLVRPFALTAAVLRAAGVGRIGVVVPVEAQRQAAATKFASGGFEPTVWAAPLDAVADRLPGWLAAGAPGGPGEPGSPAKLGAGGAPERDAAPFAHLVLDYVGHDPDAVSALQRRVGMPVFDLGLIAAAALAAIA